MVNIIVGSNGVDTLTGISTDNNIIYSNEGADSVIAGARGDKVYGWVGNDTLLGSDANDAIGGDQDNDSIMGAGGDDQLYGGSGNDTIQGNLGEDFVTGDDGDDSINAGQDDDVAYGGFGNDTISGDMGNDFLSGENGDDSLLGGAGDDELYGVFDNNNYEGGAGKDRFILSPGDATIDANDKIDTIYNFELGTLATGGTVEDTIDIRQLGVASFAQLKTMMTEVNGDTRIDFSVEYDRILIIKGVRPDQLFAQHFRLNGENLAPTASGDNYTVARDGLLLASTVLANDTDPNGDKLVAGLSTGPAHAALFQFNPDGSFTYQPKAGFEGVDSFTYIANDGSLFSGVTTVTINVGNLKDGIVDGTAGNDIINDAFVDPKDGDKISSGNDTIRGLDGDDLITGGAGNDNIDGGNGNDTILGDAGADTMNGNAGTDTADYSASGAAVTVNLVNGTGAGGDAAGDTYVSIENVIGSAFNDSITGNNANNSITGGAGVDTLTGGAGNDTLTGGAGDDRFIVEANQGANTTDQIGAPSNLFQNVTGADKIDLRPFTGITKFADLTVTGGAATNFVYTISLPGTQTLIVHAEGALDGDDFIFNPPVADGIVNGTAAGENIALNTYVDVDGDRVTTNADSINAGSGNDTIDGNAGNDTMAGGTGDDRFVVGVQPNTTDTINDFQYQGTVEKIDLTAFGYTQYTTQIRPLMTQVGADVHIALPNSQLLILKNVQLGNLSFDDFVGVSGPDGIVDGTAGNDNIILGYTDAQGDAVTNQNDSIVAGSGNDTLNGANGNDTMVGGAGDDRFVVGVQPNTTDTINDFQYQGTVEKIDLTAFGYTQYQTQIRPLMTQVGADVHIALPNSQLLILKNVTLGNLSFDDFVGVSGPDGIVDGTAGNDNIILGYTDAQGDAVTNQNDSIVAGSGNDTLNGANGNDTMVGGAGDDRFVVGVQPNTTDTINDFQYQGTVEKIDLTAFGYTQYTTQIRPLMTQVGADVHIALPNSQLLILKNVTLGNLSFDDFVGVSGPDSIVDGTAGNDNIVLGYTDAQGDAVTNQNDSIVAGSGNDTLNGANGNDTMVGGAGDDRFVVGVQPNTTDTINDFQYQGTVEKIDLTAFGYTQYTTQIRPLMTQVGADVHIALPNSQLLILKNVQLGNLSFDDFVGVSPNDGIVTGTSGNDLINTAYTDIDGDKVTTGNDTVIALDGNDTIISLAGNDSINAGAGANSVDGGDGNDTIFGGTNGQDNNNTFSGGAGDDSISIHSVFLTTSSNLVDGGAGNDTISTSLSSANGNTTATATISGGIGNDSISLGSTGTYGSYVVDGGTGDDTIFSAGGSTVNVNGGDGNDLLTLATSSSSSTGTVNGGNGNDTITSSGALNGDAGDDSIAGRNVADVLNGGTGNDTMAGGAGDDRFVVGVQPNTTDTINDFQYQGTVEKIDLSAFGYTQYVTQIRPLMTQVGADVHIALPNSQLLILKNVQLGNLSFDDFVGVSGADGIVDGTAGSDNILLGYVDVQGDAVTNQNDSIVAGSGNDTLNGANGNDTMAGGAGDDRFVVGVQPNTTDTINDFQYQGTVEQIDLTAFGYTQYQTQILPLMAQIGADVYISLPNSQVLILKNVQLSNLSANDFVGVRDKDGIVTGTAANDSITATTYVDVDGDVVTSGNDSVRALGGNDYVAGGAGNDSVDGGDGNDTIVGFDGNDSFMGGAGNDSIDGGSGNDGLDGGTGNDTISGGTGNNLIFGGEGNDLLKGGTGNDIMDGGIGLDTVDYSSSATAVNVNLFTGVGAGGDAQGDSYVGIEGIIGSSFNDTLSGSLSADSINAGSGNDTIDGNAGNDTMAGGTGDDRFVVGVQPNTTDTINDFQYQGTVEKIDLSAFGYTQYVTQIRPLMTQVGADVHITLPNSQLLILKNVQLGNLSFDDFVGVSGADGIVDGTAGNDNIILGYTDAQGDVVTNQNDSIVAGSGNDTLNGANGNDTMVGGAGDDRFVVGVQPNTTDTINDFQYQGAVEKIDLSAFGYTQYVTQIRPLMTQVGADVHIALPNSQLLILKNVQLGNLSFDDFVGVSGADGIVDGTAGNDNIILGYTDAQGDRVTTNADSIVAGSGNDTIDGNAGNDTMTGGAGDDRFVVGVQPNTTDTINDFQYQGTVEKIDLSAFGYTQYVTQIRPLMTQVGADVRITLPNNQFVILKNVQLGNLSFDDFVGVSGADGIVTGTSANETISTNYIDVDGDRVSAGNDTVLGLNGDDYIYGLGGNDSLVGGNGNDVFIGGAGADTFDGGADIDTADYRTNTQDMTVNLTTGTATGGDAQGDVLISVENVLGGSGNDIIRGSNVANNLNGGSGNDTIYDGNGNDILVGGSGADLFVVGIQPDTTDILSDFRTDVVGEQIDLTAFGFTYFAEVRALMTQAGASVRISLPNNQALYVGNTQLSALKADDFVGLRDNDNIVTGTSGNDNIRLNTYTDVDGDKVTTAADSIVAGSGNDTIDGNTGNDTMSGGVGADRFVIGVQGNTIDTINDFAVNQSGEQIDLTAFGFTQFVTQIRPLMTQVGADVRITLPNNQFVILKNVQLSQVTADDFVGVSAADGIVSGTSGNDQIDTNYVDTDGDKVTSGADRIVSGAGNDFAFGSDGNDTINGGDGDDVLLGGNGNDSLMGDAGNDNLYTDTGNDTMSGGIGADRFIIGRQANTTDQINDFAVNQSGEQIDLTAFGYTQFVTQVRPLMSQVGADVRIALPNSQFLILKNVQLSQLTADDFVGVSAADGIVNGTSGNDNIGLGYTDAQGDKVTTGNDTILGGSGNDTIDSSSGNDSVDGGVGNDVITNSGTGMDTIFGGDGNDTLVGSSQGSEADSLMGGNGDDFLHEANGSPIATGGNDTFDGGAGNDILESGFGNDLLIGGTGNDTLRGEAGTDTYRFTFNGTNGVDYVYDSGGVISIDNKVLAGSATLVSTNVYNLTVSGTVFVLTKVGANLEITKSGGSAGDKVVLVNYGNGWNFTVPTSNGIVDGTLGGDVIDQSYVDLEGDRVTSGNDRIIASNGHDVIYGFAGNDSIYGGSGDDAIDGGTGADIIDGGAGFDSVRFNNATSAVNVNLTTGVGISGNAEGDRYTSIEGISGTQYADTLVGSSVDNTIYAWAGNDIVDGAAGNDTLSGEEGDDFVSGGSGNDRLFGMDGNDRLDGNAGNDTMFGGNGNDTFVVGVQANTTDQIDDFQYQGTVEKIDLSAFGYTQFQTQIRPLMSQVGADVYIALPASQLLILKNVQLSALGADDFTGVSSSNGIVDGTAGNDVVNSNYVDVEGDKITNGNDTILGNAGNDTMYGIDGNDRMEGGDGNDIINGQAGNDTMIGGAGDDALNGDEGVNYYDGGAGVNAAWFNNITSGPVNVNLSTGVGIKSSGTDTLVNIQNIYASQFNDSIIGNAGGNLLVGLAGNDTILGNAGNDSMYGADDNDRMEGGDGNDIINGQAGNDTMIGGAGDDALNGDEGVNSYDGGAGVNAAWFNNITSGPVNVNLSTGVAIKSSGTDTLANIQNVFASSFNDSITGNSVNNYIGGREGNDTILGNAGNDTLDGGDGHDVIYGDSNVVPVQIQTGNLIRNGSFEQYTGGTGYNPKVQDLHEWIVEGGKVVTLGTNGHDNVYTTDGSSFWLNMETHNSGNAAISQAVQGVQAGATYEITLDAAKSYASKNFQENMDVIWNGQVIGNINARATHMTEYKFTVVGGSGNGSNTLQFRELGPTETLPGIYGTLIDNVEMKWVSGGTSTPTVIGNDSLLGGAGNDTLYGGGGNDTLDGGDGHDVIYGDTNTVSPSFSSGNLIKNGSFEKFNIYIEKSHYVQAQELTDWNISSSYVEPHESGVRHNATDGSYWFDFENTPGNVSISQAVQGVSAGTTYSLSFDAGSTKSGNSLDVFWGNQLVGTVSPSIGSHMTQYNFSVQGGSGDGTNVLRLVGKGPSDDNGVGVDNVKLVATSALPNTSNSEIGNDLLFGGAGNDTLVGGSGYDTITGESGNDVFQFHAANNFDTTITDYLDGSDKIQIIGASYNQLSISNVSGGALITVNVGGDADHIRVNGISASQLNQSDFLF